MKAKQPSDVRGARIRCINYIKCPVCYGCRNYNSIDPECSKCMLNKKINICKTDIHKPDVVSRFITKQSINIKEQVVFK